jgi:hypothetical protein
MIVRVGDPPCRPDEAGHLRPWLNSVPEPLRVRGAFRHRFRAT